MNDIPPGGQTDATDRKNYRADDVASARSHAHTIFRALGLTDSDEAQRRAANTQRAWTLLLRAYEPLRAAAAGLLFQDEEVSLTYPSLVAAARTYSSRRVAPTTNPDIRWSPASRPDAGIVNSRRPA